MVINCLCLRTNEWPRMSTLGVRDVTLEKAISSSGDVKNV